MFIEKSRPNFVYKYVSPSRATQILRDLTFYFSQASSLNDLFESRVRSLYPVGSLSSPPIVDRTRSPNSVSGKREFSGNWLEILESFRRRNFIPEQLETGPVSKSLPLAGLARSER